LLERSMLRKMRQPEMQTEWASEPITASSPQERFHEDWIMDSSRTYSTSSSRNLMTFLEMSSVLGLHFPVRVCSVQ
jgi:hypothetical protein